MEKLILECIKNGVSLEKLSSVTGKSEIELGKIIKNLKSNGACINTIYNDTGTINYILNNNIINKNLNFTLTSDSFRAVFISDLHIGIPTDKDGIRYIYEIYDYVVKNDIHAIFILGDLFEGVGYEKRNIYSTLNEQLNYFFENYPYESKVLNFVLLGNHDYSFVDKCGIDITNRLDTRADIINLGYGVGKLKLGNDIIGFKHDLVVKKSLDSLADCTITFRGHHHRCIVYPNNVIVPALCLKQFFSGIISTGFLDVTFDFEKENLEQIFIKHMNFIPSIKTISDIRIDKFPSKVKKKI